MSKLATLVATGLLMLSLEAAAQIEKTALPSDNGLRLLWWPKVNPPHGWHFDQGSSYEYAFNAMAPDGDTFSDAETVMYAKASFKPRMPGTRSLNALIQDDIARTTAAEPGLTAKREGIRKFGKGRSFEVVLFSPTKSGNWERVAYGEEGEYYLIFTISSRSEAGFNSAASAFESLLSHYRK